MLGVPIGKSYSSRFNRAVETARLVGGREPEATLDVSEGGLVVSPNWFEVKEGEATIFKPAGSGKYTPIARVPTEQWPTAKK
jgi:hypothetical protein